MILPVFCIFAADQTYIKTSKNLNKFGFFHVPLPTVVAVDDIS